MKTLNNRSKKLLDYLWQVAEKNDGHIKLDNDSTFMFLNVEILWNSQISLAHYGELNGDLMADPEITFLKSDNEYMPIFFQNDWVAVYNEAISFDDDGVFSITNKKLYNELIEFFNLWAENIIFQQNLEDYIKC